MSGICDLTDAAKTAAFVDFFGKHDTAELSNLLGMSIVDVEVERSVEWRSADPEPRRTHTEISIRIYRV